MIKQTAQKVSTDLLSLLAEQYPGEVHSVFETAINIMQNGRLFTLLAPGRVLSPRSMVLLQDSLFSNWPVAAKMPVTVKGGVLIVGSAGKPVEVSFAHADMVNLFLGDKSALCRPLRAKDRTAALAGVIFHSEQAPESLAALLGRFYPEISLPFAENVYCKFLKERIEQLFTALQAFDINACAQLAGRLAGCGQGLTPSSDDFLTGVIAAIYGAATTAKIDWEIAKHMCAGIAENAAPRTNVISAGFLETSAAGFFSEDVLALIELYYSHAPVKQLCEAACRVAAFGSTSGIDFLTGFCFGVSA